MKVILILLSLSMIWRGSIINENGDFDLRYAISFACAVAAWIITLFGNVVE